MTTRTHHVENFWETVKVVKIAEEHFVFQEKVNINVAKRSNNKGGVTTYREITDHRLIPLMNLIDEKELVQHLEMDEDVDDMKEL
jgi:hypothetical protein